MTEEDKCTYKELIEILLSAAASMLVEKNLDAKILPLKDDDVGSLLYILENIYYDQEDDDTITPEEEGKIIAEATAEYEVTVDRPIPKEEEK